MSEMADISPKRVWKFWKIFLSFFYLIVMRVKLRQQTSGEPLSPEWDTNQDGCDYMVDILDY